MPHLSVVCNLVTLQLPFQLLKPIFKPLHATALLRGRRSTRQKRAATTTFEEEGVHAERHIFRVRTPCRTKEIDLGPTALTFLAVVVVVVLFGRFPAIIGAAHVPMVRFSVVPLQEGTRASFGVTALVTREHRLCKKSGER